MLIGIVSIVDGVNQFYYARDLDIYLLISTVSIPQQY